MTNPQINGSWGKASPLEPRPSDGWDNTEAQLCHHAWLGTVQISPNQWTGVRSYPLWYVNHDREPTPTKPARSYAPDPTIRGRGNVAASRRAGIPWGTAIPRTMAPRRYPRITGTGTKITTARTCPSHVGKLVNNHHTHSAAMTGTVTRRALPWREEQEPGGHARVHLQKPGQDKEGPLSSFSLILGLLTARVRRTLLFYLSSGPWDYIKGAGPSFKTIYQHKCEHNIVVSWCPQRHNVVLMFESYGDFFLSIFSFSSCIHI
jgi:hypothetical protein